MIEQRELNMSGVEVVVYADHNAAPGLGFTWLGTQATSPFVFTYAEGWALVDALIQALVENQEKYNHPE